MTRHETNSVSRMQYSIVFASPERRVGARRSVCAKAPIDKSRNRDCVGHTSLAKTNYDGLLLETHFVNLIGLVV